MPTTLIAGAPLPAIGPAGRPRVGVASIGRAALVKFAREPLVHFAVLAAAISGAVHLSAPNERYRIHVGLAERARIVAKYSMQYGEPPTAAQLQALIQHHIREEIFVREARSLGLDRDDEIVRRRLAQKYEFLQSDLVSPAAPDEAQLESWFSERASRYLVPARVTFTQVYFSLDRTSTTAAKARALDALGRLRTAGTRYAASLGDPFPGPSEVRDVTPEGARRLFGDSELDHRLFGLPIGEWSGPYLSGYGWHLVLIRARRSAEVPGFAQVRAQVMADYLEEARHAMEAREFEALKARYRLVFDQREP